MNYPILLAGVTLLGAQLWHALLPSPAGPVSPMSWVSRSPADAYRWAAYAESLASAKRAPEARAAFHRAATLAPDVPQIRMRRMNDCLELADSNCILSDGKRVLALTATFDDIIFVYYRSLTIPQVRILAEGLPDTPRALRSYMRNFAKFSDDDSAIFRTWSHIRSRGFMDAPTASAVAATLVTRRRNVLASRLWRDFDPRVAPNEALSNPRFTRQPLPSPFDWAVSPQDGMTFDFTDGLHVTFEGARNLSVANVRQHFVAQPGPHRLVIEYSSDALTTDQGPFFRLYDPASPARLNLQTGMIRGTTPRRTLTLDFTAPPASPLLALHLERTPSQKFDNKISGSLHLYRVSVQALGPPLTALAGLARARAPDTRRR